MNRKNNFQTFSFIVALALLGLVLGKGGPAEAIRTTTSTGLGDLSVSIDTTLSAGISAKVKNMNKRDYVASQSGGNDYVRDLPPCNPMATPPITPPGCLTVIPLPSGRIYGYKDDNDKNFAGNQNNDDGRLNFEDAGDITGATLKALFDIETNLASEFGDFTLFARVNAFYDPVLHGDFGYDDAYDRLEPGDSGKRELGRDLQLLDLSLNWDYDIDTSELFGDIAYSVPISLKVGKLAANNWGESTFSLSGIAQGIVIDVPAARRPGAQIKEIIQTEYMVYGSVGLPFDIGLDAYYQFHHTPWVLSPSGSPFSTSDTPNPTSAAAEHLWLSGGSTTGTFRRNCEVGIDGLSRGGLMSQVSQDVLGNCDTDSVIHFDNPYYDAEPNMPAELVRLANGDMLRARVKHVEADNQGQFGVQLSYYFPYLNGIEFNFSYQNVHSRIPYARVRTDGPPVLGSTTIGGDSTQGGNALHGLGCTGVNPALNAVTGGGYLASGRFFDPGLQPETYGEGYRAPKGRVEEILTGVTFGGEENGLLVQGNRGEVKDANNLKLALDSRFGGTPKGGPGLRDVGIYYDTDPEGYNALTQNENSYWQQLARAADTALLRDTLNLNSDPVPLHGDVENGGALTIAESIRANGITPYDVNRIKCAIYKDLMVDSGDSGAVGTLSAIGTEYPSLQYNIRMDLYYPQNLKVIGLGFNTTIPWLEWGLQGEVAYRPDTPLQQDVTEQIIANASAQGSGATNLGDSAGIALAPLVTTGADGEGGVSVADTDWNYTSSDAINIGLGVAGLAGKIGGQMQLAGDIGDQLGGAFAPGGSREDDEPPLTTQELAGVTARITELVTGGLVPEQAGPQAALEFAAVDDPNEGLNIGGLAGVAAQVARLQAEGRSAVNAVTVAAMDAALATPTGMAVKEGYPMARSHNSHTFASGFNPAVFECYVLDECGGEGIIEKDMLSLTLGTTALYNASHPVMSLLGADVGVFLIEFNAIHFTDDLDEGPDGATGINRANKAPTLHCIRRTGTQLPLGSLVGLDPINDFGCTGDTTSMGYTLFGYLEYNNVFGTAWRVRPSLSVRHGFYGNTPSPIPGWREDTLSVNVGLRFAFQSSWQIDLGYVGYYDVGSKDFNNNAGLDTISASVSYAF